MRIAVYHNLPSGGAKRTLFEEIKRLSTNHDIDVYCLASANHDFADIRPYVDNYHIYDFKPQPLLVSPFGRLNQAIRLIDLQRIRSISRKIAKDIDTGGYDMLFSHPCQYENCPSVIRSIKSKSVFYCHEPLRVVYESVPARPYDRADSQSRNFLNRIDPLPWLYFKFLERNDKQNIEFADNVLVNSEFTRDTVRQVYLVNAYVSYHGVDANLFRPVQIDKENMVLSVGSLTPLKGFDFLIEAMANIAAQKRPVLAIASNFQNPPERNYLLKLASKKQVDLRLFANVSDEKLVQLYNQAKLTVYAPIREPFGLVALESMACGTPVVAVREGGIVESVVNNITGLIVDRDVAQFANAMQKLIDDSQLAKLFGENGREHVIQNWTWNHAVKRLEQQILSSVQNRR